MNKSYVFGACVLALIACASSEDNSSPIIGQTTLAVHGTLPICTAEHEGKVFYTAPTNSLMACVSNHWVNIVLPAGPQGPMGPQGTPGVCSCNNDAGADASVCPSGILPPSCQSGTFINSNCFMQCYGDYYPPNSPSGNGGACGGGLVEGPGDGSDACFCLPTGVGAPNSGCPSDGQLHYFVNGSWQ